MAMMPGAVDRRLANQARQGRMRSYQAVALHTMVGSLAGTDSMFRRGGTVGTESHFGVGGDGTIYQWVDTAYSADANYLGSAHVISIETEDYGGIFGRWNTSGDNVPAWTNAQIVALAKIITWCHETHGIPIRQMGHITERGVGYHAMGVPRNGLPAKYAGTKYQWSKYPGKVCPGRRRIAQIPQIVALAAGGATPTPTDQEGILGMLDDIDFKRSKPFDIKPNAGLRHIPIDDSGNNYSALSGPADFILGAKVDVVGLDAGMTAYFVLFEYLYSKNLGSRMGREFACQELTGVDGRPLTASVAGSWRLKKDWRGRNPRLRLAVSTNDTGVTVRNLLGAGLASKK